MKEKEQKRLIETEVKEIRAETEIEREKQLRLTLQKMREKGILSDE
jgi:hypothetical protein